MNKAQWWEKYGENIKCTLCPHYCVLKNNVYGKCGVRVNKNGKLELPGYGMITAQAADPVEKKPLYHFYPSSSVWSIGFAGCNLKCPYCQNYSISTAPAGTGVYQNPPDPVLKAEQSGCSIIAYTYSEPSIHYEYITETALLARQHGLKNILVTNGMLNPEPWKKLLAEMDAVNIDLKSFEPSYYSTVLDGSLNAVKKNIISAVEKTWVEITVLVVPGDNDNPEQFKMLVNWIEKISADIPLHLSAYYPSWKYTKEPTGLKKLTELAGIAREKLNFVYLGNTGTDNNTICPVCGSEVIKRRYYFTENYLENGKCPECGNKLPGIFS